MELARIELEGTYMAESGTGRDSLVKRDKSFLDPEIVFANYLEAKVRTRLGDEGIEVEFDPKPKSPISPNRPIPSLAIPGHLSHGLDAGSPVPTNETDEGFEFGIGNRRFGYDRLGLRAK